MDDRLDGRLLIGCGLKPKTITKNLVVLHGDLKGLPRSGSALRIECQELGRSVAGLLGRTTAGLFPLARTQQVEWGAVEIGRASCRERGERAGGAGSVGRTENQVMS